MPHAEIESWSRLSGTPVSPFIVEAIRAMSGAYLSMQSEAQKPDCPNPTKPELVRRRTEEAEAPRPAPAMPKTHSSRKIKKK